MALPTPTAHLLSPSPVSTSLPAVGRGHPLSTPAGTGTGTGTGTAVPPAPLASDDVEVQAALNDVGGLLQVDDLLRADCVVFEELRRKYNVDDERAEVLQLVMDNLTVLHGLFLYYSDVSVAVKGLPWQSTAPQHGAEPDTPMFSAIGDHNAISEQQFWEFTVSAGLITRWFNRAAVKKAWRDAVKVVVFGTSVPPVAMTPARLLSAVASSSAPGPHLPEPLLAPTPIVPAAAPLSPTSTLPDSVAPPARLTSKLSLPATDASPAPPRTGPRRPRPTPKLTPSPRVTRHRPMGRHVVAVAPSPLTARRVHRPPISAPLTTPSFMDGIATTLRFDDSVGGSGAGTGRAAAAMGLRATQAATPTTAPTATDTPPTPADRALFPKFIEALLRLCAARYQPMDAASVRDAQRRVADAEMEAERRQLEEARAALHADVGVDLGVHATGSAGASSSTGTGTGTSAASGQGGDAKHGAPAAALVAEVPTLSERLRHAFEAHVLPLARSTRLPEPPTGLLDASAPVPDTGTWQAGDSPSPVRGGGAGRAGADRAAQRSADEYWETFVPGCCDGCTTSSSPCARQAPVLPSLAAAAAGASSSSPPPPHHHGPSDELLTASGPYAPSSEQDWLRAVVVVQRHRNRLEKVFASFAVKSPTHSDMNVREFLYMLKVLQVLDPYKLTLREAARLVVATAAFMGDCDCHALPFAVFCDALARVCDVKTHDGALPLAARLDQFLIGVVFPRMRAITGAALIWD